MRKIWVGLQYLLVKLKVVPQPVLVLEGESVGREEPLEGLPHLDHAPELGYLGPGPRPLLRHLPLTLGLVTGQTPEQIPPALTSCLNMSTPSL